LLQYARCINNTTSIKACFVLYIQVKGNISHFLTRMYFFKETIPFGKIKHTMIPARWIALHHKFISSNHCLNHIIKVLQFSSKSANHVIPHAHIQLCPIPHDTIALFCSHTEDINPLSYLQNTTLNFYRKDCKSFNSRSNFSRRLLKYILPSLLSV